MQNWRRKPLLLLLEQIVGGGGSMNMTKVIVEVIERYGGVYSKDLQSRLASFGVGKPRIRPLHVVSLSLHVCKSCCMLADVYAYKRPC